MNAFSHHEDGLDGFRGLLAGVVCSIVVLGLVAAIVFLVIL